MAGQQLESSLAGWFWLKVSREITVKILARTVVIWKLRLEDLLPKRSIYMKGELELAEAGGLSSSPPGPFQRNSLLVSSRASDPRDSKVESARSHMTQPQKACLVISHYPIDHTGWPYSVWEGLTTQESDYRELRTIGNYMEANPPLGYFPIHCFLVTLLRQVMAQ